MIEIAISDFPNFDPAGLLDARVRVAGVVGGTFDSTEERIVGLRLNVNKSSAITFLSPPGSASSRSTTMSLADVLASNESLRPWHRIVTTGTVTLYDPGELLVIQDGSSGLLIHTRQVDKLAIGQRVSVTGFVAATEGATSMELGQFTPLPARGTVASRPITFADAMTGFYTNRLLSLEGTVVSQTRENHAHILFLRSGNQTVQAVFRKRTSDPDPSPTTHPELICASLVFALCTSAVSGARLRAFSSAFAPRVISPFFNRRPGGPSATFLSLPPPSLAWHSSHSRGVCSCGAASSRTKPSFARRANSRPSA